MHTTYAKIKCDGTLLTRAEEEPCVECSLVAKSRVVIETAPLFWNYDNTRNRKQIEHQCLMQELRITFSCGNSLPGIMSARSAWPCSSRSQDTRV